MKLAFLKKIKHFRNNIILMTLGIIIFLYFTITSIYWRRFDVFNFLVSLTGILLIIMSFKITLIIGTLKKRPKIMQYLLQLFLACFILSFIIIQSIIVYNMRSTPAAEADYIIVLGCQVAGEYASLPLLQRGIRPLDI